MSRSTIRDDRTDTSHLSPYLKKVMAVAWGTQAQLTAEADEAFKAEVAKRPHVFVAKYGRRNPKS